MSRTIYTHSKYARDVSQLSDETVISDPFSLRFYKVNKDPKVVWVQPSPGYIPGEHSPIRHRPPPPAPTPALDGKVVAQEMIQDTLEDLYDYEEWDVHRCNVTMCTALSTVIGIIMVLAGTSSTPLFYSIPTNYILVGFGSIFFLPFFRWFIIVFLPYAHEKNRRRAIKKKQKQRRKQELQNVRFQIFEDLHHNRLQPVLIEKIVSGEVNDDLSVLTMSTLGGESKGDESRRSESRSTQRDSRGDFASLQKAKRESNGNSKGNVARNSGPQNV